MNRLAHPLVTAILAAFPGATVTTRSDRIMIDPNPTELRAMDAASDAAGAVIEEIGNTDMAQWSAEQWHGFIRAICGGYVESLMQQQYEANEAANRIAVAA